MKNDKNLSKNLLKIDEKNDKNQKLRTNLSAIYYGFLGLNIDFWGIVNLDSR
jgi:hypothetical protein